MPKQVLITGASSELGVAVCRRYIHAGYVVIAHYRRNASCFEQLRIKANDRLIKIQADFSNTNTIKQFINDNRKLFDATDVLINMAAMRNSVAFEAMTPEDLLRHFTANVIPAVMLIQQLGPRMAERGWGRIVNISSIGVKFGGGQGTFCYSLTKHTSEFMPAIHREWAVRNVFVNAVRLGVTESRYSRDMSIEEREARTALIPVKRMATPKEMAEFIYFLGSEHNTFMTGQVVSPSGGE